MVSRKCKSYAFSLDLVHDNIRRKLRGYKSPEVLLSSAPFHTIVVLLNFCTLQYTKS